MNADHSVVKPLWFWAKDKGPTEREWAQYPDEVCAALEAALSKGESKVAISKLHLVDFTSGGSSSSASLGTYRQYRTDNPGLTRPVVRTADASVPANPPPPPPGAAAPKSAVAAATAALAT